MEAIEVAKRGARMGARGLQLGSHRSSENRGREWVLADCSQKYRREAPTMGVRGLQLGAINIRKRGAENGRSRIAAGEPPQK